MTTTGACGTDRGYQRHRYRKTLPCGACLEAHRLYVQGQRAGGPKPVRELVPCGSPSAYRRHIRRGEKACPACLAAQAADVARYSRKRVAA